MIAVIIKTTRTKRVSLSHLPLPVKTRPRASNVSNLGGAWYVVGIVCFLLHQLLYAQYLVDST